ncbi:MAG: protein-glutamate O-methyltransferase CheR [Desulfatiglandaceae bacterium]
MNLISSELSERDFKHVSDIVYSICGINLKNGKEALVRARLTKRLRVLKLGSFKEYMHLINGDEGQKEIGFLIDAMTTNKTSFFRESAHFNYLRDVIIPETNTRKMRFWTAACSSGEEPFSLCMLLHETIPNIALKDILILATDISVSMLKKARMATYGKETIRDLPPTFLKKYFVQHRSKEGSLYRVKDDIRANVRFAWLNLLEPWPMRGPFNVIFCRNVMIYFDRPTQQKLINRFWDILASGGHLFVGHSEGLSAIKHKFHYVQPAIYRK